MENEGQHLSNYVENSSDTAGAASNAAAADFGGDASVPVRRGGNAKSDSAAEPSDRTRREEFERLISGEFKDAFTERVAGIIAKRLGENRAAKQKAEQSPPAAGGAPGEGDTPPLGHAGGSGPASPEGEAGFAATPAAAAVRFAAHSARAADEAEALYAEWTSSAKELKRDYPAFDLASAAKEPAFRRLLSGGADLRSAYEATHMDAVRGAIRAAAAAEAEARVLDGVRLRGMRPEENGARSGGAVLTGGMAGLSRAERASLAEKAMRGLL